MNLMQIKVCGLKEASNMTEIDALKPDFMGIIFHPGSPRFAGGKSFPKTSAIKVGVFVDGPIHFIMRQAEKHGFDHLQLHGNETLSTVKELYENGFHVIKTFSVSEEIDIELLAEFTPYCDYFLFDTKGKKPGGNGLKFNWALLKKYSLKTPFFLSGGIGPEDLTAIKKIKHPAFAGIDLNSRFERLPGIKDSKTLKPFIDDIRK